MSPIPKPPRAKTPIQKAIESLMAQASKPPMVIVHPSDAEEVKRLLADAKNAPLTVGPGSKVEVSEGPLMKAYRESLENQLLSPERVQTYLQGQVALKTIYGTPVAGRTVTGMSFDEAGTSLQRDLEDSLWALADKHESVRTWADMSRHMRAGHLTDDLMLKRPRDNHEVLVWCPCKTVLALPRCAWNTTTEGARLCDEFVLEKEFCSVHEAEARAFFEREQQWKPGSRFYRCSYIGTPHDQSTRCTRVATLVHVDGTHWCNKEGHHP